MIRRQDKDLSKSKPIKGSLKILENIGFIIIMVIMSMLLFITAQSRITGKEPSLLGHRIYIVDSGSMSPTMQVDSMIIVRELKKEEIVPKDIITYYGHNEESRITHRVMEVNNNGESFVTKGDANQVNDPLPLDGNKLIGKVVMVIPFIGRIFRMLSTRFAMAIVISIGILWMIFPKLFPKKA